MMGYFFEQGLGKFLFGKNVLKFESPTLNHHNYINSVGDGAFNAHKCIEYLEIMYRVLV